MNEREIVRELIAKEGTNIRQVALKLGYANNCGLANRINGENKLSLGVLESVLELLGYELVIRKKGKKKDEYIIENK